MGALGSLNSITTQTPTLLLFLFPHRTKHLHPFPAKPRFSKPTRTGFPNHRIRISNETTRNPRISEELQKEAEDILEWPSVCAQLTAFATTSAARARCRGGGLRPGRSREESEILLRQTDAAAAIPEPLDFSGVDGDILEILDSAAGGGLLGIQQLCAVERSIRSARTVFEQLQGISRAGESSDRYYPLLDILQNCDFLTEIADKIGFCVDCTLSTIPDRASPKLKSMRLERRENMEKLDSLLKEVSVKIFHAGAIDSPLITKRRSRMCVGIKASHKSMLSGGIVLSVSSSGATYFMEPGDAVELNNMEVRLSNSERAEELAILGFLTSEVAASDMKIRHLMEKIVELDLACARGAYALWMNGVCPVFMEVKEKRESNENVLSVDIEAMQHPLLLEPTLVPKKLNTEVEGLTTRNSTKGPVPLNIKIGNTIKVVVISGPNTGGKTATMKTLGLASLMSKAGMFLPAKNEPRLPWFDQILADIGDHQSLEHNLSTFSGHISRICKIIEVVSVESLVLIDEIGSGTDPSEGVALSTSILQHLASCVNLAMVTTHYADLSRLKSIDSRFENAAMEFSMETLQPTFHILWGSTGDSNALSIAKSIGFDEEVLHRAQEWVVKLVPDKLKERQGFLYQSLLEERNSLEAQAKEAASVLAQVKMLHKEIQSEAEDLDKRVTTLKVKESQKVHLEVKTMKSQMDAVIRNFEIQLQNANPDQLSSLVRESEAAIASVTAAHKPKGNVSYGEAERQISYIPQLGDKVYVKGLGDKLATIVEVVAEDGTTMVQCGKIKVRVKRNDIKPIQSSMKHLMNSSAQRLTRQEHARKLGRYSEEKKDEGRSFGPAVRTSKNTVDLRGMRVEEASHQLHMAISGCSSFAVLFVVHGTGSGAVKEAALNILRNHPRVAKFEEESPMNYGCTIAYIS